jgi:asparagine synthase (glutamine-hydrolysing)
MCGITGFLNLDGRPADRYALQRMIRTLDHRGPDDTGMYVDGAIALAHNRLSIIDIGGGHQPMAAGDLWITFNGEIFNFVELRHILRQKGHILSTQSDTEVILHLYQEYGPDCVSLMNGQWAFAIWDARRRRLFLSRDRMGVRPLFYSLAGNTFTFGSEVKSVLAYPGTPRELDLEALQQVFTFWFTLAPRTIFKNVVELAPGCSLMVEDGALRLNRYWRLDYSGNGNGCGASAKDELRYQEELGALLLDSTRLRVRADVPVGTYLSGGLDSSIITALTAKVLGTPLNTFSLAFEDSGFDESEYQQEVAANLKTNHRMIRCSASDIARVFPDVIWHVERPILRTAPAPLFLLSRLVQESGLKVVLTGEGSDEFLGGYDIYKEAKIREFCNAQNGSSRRPLLFKRLYPYLHHLQKQPPAYLHAFFNCGPEDAADPFFSHLPRWRLTARTQAFFAGPIREPLKNHDAYGDLREMLPEGFSRWKTLSRAEYLEAAFFLPGYLLSSQGDRVAMAHAVECRYPFLDYRIAELATHIPQPLKMKVLDEKYLLKKVFGGLVPESVKNRSKQPYRAPDATSFFDPLTGKCRQAYVEELLSPQQIRDYGVFDAVAVQKLVVKAKAGRALGFLENAALVGILSTQIVIDQFISHFEEKLSYAIGRAGDTYVCH